MFNWLINWIMGDIEEPEKTPERVPEPEEDDAWLYFHLSDRIYSAFPLIRPGIRYYRRLQEAYCSAVAKVWELEDEIARNMNKAVIETAESNLKKCNSLQIELGAVKGELITARAENDFLKEKLKWYQDRESAKTAAREEQPKETTTSRFVSSDGVPGREKKKLCYLYKLSGWTNSEIAEELHIKESCISPYCSEAKKHSTIQTHNGTDSVVYDSAWGSDSYEITKPATLAEMVSDKSKVG